MKRVARTFSLGLAVFLLAGCNGSGKEQELRQWMNDTVAKPGAPIEPLPEFVAYEPFAYSAAGMRNPFEAPQPAPRRPVRGGKEVKPDLNRPRQYLEQFNVIDLRMVGTLARTGEFFGLIQEPSGSVHRIRVGDYMGQNHGRVISLNENEIQLTEIVSDGVGGWLERNRAVRLGGEQAETS